MDNMDKQIRFGKDLARRDRCGSFEEWIRKFAGTRMVRVGALNKKFPVKARVDHNRWIADCECGGAEYVDPDEPIFFCFSCDNMAFNNMLRPVIFPGKRAMARIEKNLSEKNFFSWKEEVEDGV